MYVSGKVYYRIARNIGENYVWRFAENTRLAVSNFGDLPHSQPSIGTRLWTTPRKWIMADFMLVVLQQTANSPIFIPCQYFRLYGRVWHERSCILQLLCLAYIRNTWHIHYYLQFDYIATLGAYTIPAASCIPVASASPIQYFQYVYIAHCERTNIHTNIYIHARGWK